MPTSKVATISIDAIPASGSLKVETSLLSSQTGFHMTGLYPATLYLSPTMVSPLTTYDLGTTDIQELDEGLYSLNITLGGSASHLYRVSYSYISGGNELTLLSEGEQPPVPLLSSATFSDDGTYISVLFDSNTDRTRRRSSFGCSRLFSFSSADKFSCVFVSDIECLVSLLSATNDITETELPQPGDVIVLLEGKIRAKCTDDVACSSWNRTSSVTATSADGLRANLTASSSPVKPRVVISSPERVGNCDDFPLSLTSSTGSGGRTWSRVIFNISCSDNSDTSAITAWLDTNYRFNPASSLPRYTFNEGV